MKFKQLFEAEEEKAKESERFPSKLDAKWLRRYLKNAKGKLPSLAFIDQQHDFMPIPIKDVPFSPEEIKQMDAKMDIIKKKFFQKEPIEYIHKIGNPEFLPFDASGSMGHKPFPGVKKEWNYPWGTKFLYDDKEEFHAEGKPAIVIPNGRKEWWMHGKRHRIDGPAVEGPKGRKEWWINNKLAKVGYPVVYIGELALTDDEKWELIKGNPENIEAIDKPTEEMQEYIIKKRPDLIRSIDHLSKAMTDKYGYDLDTYGIEL
jgi:hypothetical protein